jgi:hypothetical protein
MLINILIIKIQKTKESLKRRKLKQKDINRFVKDKANKKYFKVTQSFLN